MRLKDIKSLEKIEDEIVLLEGKASTGKELPINNFVDRISSTKNFSDDEADAVRRKAYRALDVPVNKQNLSINSKGTLTSMQQHISPAFDYDEAREKAILESKDIVEEYNAYLNFQFDKLLQYTKNADGTHDNIWVEGIRSTYEELKVLTDEHGISQNEIKRYMIDSFFEVSNNPNTIKRFLRLRLNYNRRMIQLMEKMLKNNYRQLGLTDKEIEFKIQQLHSNSLNQNKNDIVEIIRKNESNYVKRKGFVDLRELGFGVFLRTEESVGELENMASWDHYIQQMMRYDAVILAHGGDTDKEYSNAHTRLAQYKKDVTDYVNKNAPPENTLPKNIFETKYDSVYAKAIEDFDKAVAKYIADGGEDVLTPVGKKLSLTLGYRLFNSIGVNRMIAVDAYRELTNNHCSITSISHGDPDRLLNFPDVIGEAIPEKATPVSCPNDYFEIYKAHYLSDNSITMDTANEYVKEHSDTFDILTSIPTIKPHVKKIISILMSFYKDVFAFFNKNISYYNGFVNIATNANKELDGKLVEYLTTKEKYMEASEDNRWTCQPVKTPGGLTLIDVNDLLRQLVKEGFKSIHLNCCNPGHHEIDPDILKIKGVHIHYSKNTQIAESTEPDSENWYDLCESSMVTAEKQLYETAKANGIDFYNDEYLMECMNTDFDSEFVQEGILKDAWESAVKLVKKVLAAIIGFFKAIINFVRNVIRKIKEKLTGKPSDKIPKTKTTVITLEAAQVKDKEIDSYKELEQLVTSACAKISQKIQQMDQKQTQITSQIVKQCEKNAKEASMESFTYKGKEVSSDIMESILFIELAKKDISYNEGLMMESTEIKKVLEDGGFCPNQRNLNEITPMDRYPVTPANRATDSTLSIFEDIIAAETDEEITECMMNLGRLSFDINCNYSVLEGTDIVLEGAASSARELARKGREGVRKASNKVGGTAKEVNTNVNKVLDPMEKFINSSMDKIKKADSEERRAMIMKGGIVPKITRWIKRGIAIALGLTAGTVIPAAALISGIAFIGWITTDKYMDSMEKKRILKELDDEIEIINEKLDDSRADSNRQKKYELMRIRNKLKRTADRIRYNLKTPNEDDIIKPNKAKK